MKVHKEPKKYSPVSIVLESQHELQTMYDLLNCSEVRHFLELQGICVAQVRWLLKTAGAAFSEREHSILPD